MADYIQRRKTILITDWNNLTDAEKVDACTRVELVDAKGDPDITTMVTFYAGLPGKTRKIAEGLMIQWLNAHIRNTNEALEERKYVRDYKEAQEKADANEVNVKTEKAKDAV